MKRAETTHPDIYDILQRKAEGRREISRRPFGEKIAMMERLRERLARSSDCVATTCRETCASAGLLHAFPSHCFLDHFSAP
jgi:hypothetical protein